MIAWKESLIGAGAAATRGQAFTPTAILEAVPGIHGFHDASSMERLPVETVLTEQIRACKRVAF